MEFDLTDEEQDRVGRALHAARLRAEGGDPLAKIDLEIARDLLRRGDRYIVEHAQTIIDNEGETPSRQKGPEAKGNVELSAQYTSHILLSMTAEEGALVLPDDIGFYIRVLQMRMFHEFYRAFEGVGLTPTMHTALVIIGYNPGMRQGSLAQPLMVKPTQITRLVVELHEAGMIARKTDPNDRRTIHLYLSRRGRQLLETMQAPLNTLEQKILRNLDLQQRLTFRQLLQRVT